VTHGATKQRIGRDPETLAHFASFHTWCKRQHKTKRQHGRWRGGAVIGPLADERRSPMGPRAALTSGGGSPRSSSWNLRGSITGERWRHGIPFLGRVSSDPVRCPRRPGADERRRPHGMVNGSEHRQATARAENRQALGPLHGPCHQ
jgi:hypothetical protein